MSLLRVRPRALSVVLLAASLLGANLLTEAPVQAATRVMPGSFTGYAFDTCHTQEQEVMDTWLERSPYWGVGVYVAGVNRYCADQPLLTSEWVSTQSRKGWRILPITVGPQAACTGVKRYQEPGRRIDDDPTDGYLAARQMGRAEARSTVKAVRALGIAERSTLWYDIEAFDIDNPGCRESALGFLSAWTRQLHGLRYRSGVYSSASSGITMLDQARVEQPGVYTLPDQIWVGEWSHASTVAKAHRTASTDSAYVSPDGWAPHARVRQFLGGHDETYGGVTVNIDSDFMDVGRGSVAGRPTPHCGVNVDFARYRRQSLGNRTPQVSAAQCLLRRAKYYPGKVTGRFNRMTFRAVKRYQRTHALPVTGAMTVRTWTVLLAQGRSPLMKFGSAGNDVRRVQRALNAADGAGLTVSGVYDRATASAVRSYRAGHALPRSEVVAADLWALLHTGRV